MLKQGVHAHNVGLLDSGRIRNLGGFKDVRPRQEGLSKDEIAV